MLELLGLGRDCSSLPRYWNYTLLFVNLPKARSDDSEPRYALPQEERPS